MVMIQEKVSRREVMIAGGVLALTPVSAIKVAATDSGFIELEANVTIPSGDFGIDVRIFEDLDGNGNADFQQQISLNDGTETYEYDGLQGETGQGIHYWMDIQMTGDGSDTPEVHSLEITLPEETEADGPDYDWYDNFSDGNVDGWDSPVDDQPTAVSDSYLGNFSLYQETEGSERGVWWIDGPLLDMQDKFLIEGIIKTNYDDPTNGGAIRMGIVSDDITEPGENAILIFHENDDAIYLATSTEDDLPDPENRIDNYNAEFQDEWVHFIMESDVDDSELRAKIWKVDDPEPSEFQLTDSFDAISGQFNADVGDDPNYREIYIDEIGVSGEVFVPEVHEDLYINAREFVILDESIPYNIRYNHPEDGWKDLSTDEVDKIVVNDENIVQLDEENERIEGISRGETFIELEHNGLISAHDISCADIDISDLQYLPLSRKIQAVATDRPSRVIFFSAIAGVGIGQVISNFSSTGKGSNAWIALGSAFLIIMLAGFQGWVSNGIVFSALFFVIISSLIIGKVRKNEVGVVHQE